jgi:alpha-L-fucosidase
MKTNKESFMTTETSEQRNQRMSWWREATFGMFIHWGLYSILGRGEWVMNRENIPLEEYEKLALKFNPRYYEPRAWARLAREAGMKYMVLTTKHHDGFCLWDSQLTDYTAVKTTARRDLVREFADSCRFEGLKVGFYFSLLDWHHPDGDGRGLSDETVRKRFISFVHGQVRELMSNYGRVDILWYDVPWPYEAEGWESVKLNAMVRELQPHIIINNRSKLDEDFGTPEQHVKAEEGRDWEACMTLNCNWGFRKGDSRYKDAHEVIKLLGECARSGGNMLLNVGPDADGLIPSESQSILRQVGAWLRRNGAAIYGSQRANVGWDTFGLMTVKGKTLFLLIDKWSGSQFSIGRITGTARSACLLANGERVELRQEGSRIHLTGLPQNPPDTPFSVIAIEFEDEPIHASGPSCVWPTYGWGDPLKSPTDGKDCR